MANKLRNLFDDGNRELTGKFSFENIEKHKAFVEAINKATKEGIPTAVDGIREISISFKDGDSQYPLKKDEKVTSVVIYPCETPIDIGVDTDKGKRDVRFLKKELKEKVELENIDKKGADIKIVFDFKEKKAVLNYNAKMEKADSLDELIDYFNTMYFLCKKMFGTDVESEEVENMANFFMTNVIFFEQLQCISKKLGIQILPSEIKDIENDDFFIERLYFSLIESRVLRSNQKVLSMNNISFIDDKNPGDNPMIATYLEQGRVMLCGKEVNIFIVSMAFNLLIDKEELIENGNSKLFFKDTEKDPIYISSRIFLNEEEAQKELEVAMENKEPYIEAKTLGECIRDCYEDYKACKTV